MDKVKSIAERLNGIEYRDDIPREIIEEAKANRIVIVFGRSDDLMEFEGAIYDEVGCYEGGSCVVNHEGKIGAKGGKTIRALWCDKKSEFTWSYKTKIPHETFDMFDEDEKYCRGIVFSLDSLKEDTPEDIVKKTLDYIEEELKDCRKRLNEEVEDEAYIQAVTAREIALEEASSEIFAEAHRQAEALPWKKAILVYVGLPEVYDE